MCCGFPVGLSTFSPFPPLLLTCIKGLSQEPGDELITHLTSHDLREIHVLRRSKHPCTWHTASPASAGNHYE